MSLIDESIRVLDDWYSNLQTYTDHLPSRGSIAAALHVLERLRTSFNLDVANHVSEGESQIAGLSSSTLNRLLARFDEQRRLSAVAGRSNRGARGDIANLLTSMRSLELGNVSDEARSKVLEAMQSHIVTDYVSKYFAVQRVRAVFDANAPTRKCIEAILRNAKDSRKAGPVAEHLVGAKLALRFPQMEIRNKPFSEADVQGGFVGDFEIGSTAFHVTMAPMQPLFEKCNMNLQSGLQVYLLVPDVHLAGARDNSELLSNGRIAVESLETFVATNVDELAEFEGSLLKSGIRRLLEKYNERVAAIEHDQSLLIDIPPNL
jgi:hypothetical protein